MSTFPFDLGQVRLTSSRWLDNQNRTLAYLSFVDVDRLLYNFRANHRLSTEAAAPTGGWDDPASPFRTHVQGRNSPAARAASPNSSDSPSAAAGPSGAIPRFLTSATVCTTCLAHQMDAPGARLWPGAGVLSSSMVGIRARKSGSRTSSASSIQASNCSGVGSSGSSMCAGDLGDRRAAAQDAAHVVEPEAQLPQGAHQLDAGHGRSPRHRRPGGCSLR
ncbi:beta-L-arabinofuranosidase domain-containing protein [Streptomyces virginiae]|uniref:beta-L-arabinofuranosidase domain-containing protein n=1 Tax=Streptomyces virginiae TaxID=1961 RepID=UPI00343C29A7